MEGSREDQVQTAAAVERLVVVRLRFLREVTFKERQQTFQEDSWKVTSRRRTPNESPVSVHSYNILAFESFSVAELGRAGRISLAG